MTHLFNLVLQDVITVIITVHLISAIVIIQNPVAQLLDRFLHIQPGFNLRRFIFRTLTLGFYIGIAYSVPNDDFLCLVNLIGASTTSTLAFVFPSAFYLLLRRKGFHDPTIPAHQSPSISTSEFLFHGLIIVAGLFGGVSAFKSAVQGCPF